jgi:hypothetical protein
MLKRDHLAREIPVSRTGSSNLAALARRRTKSPVENRSLVFIPGGPIPASISRRKAHRMNSARLSFSCRAFSAQRVCVWRGTRNVTGTLPCGSFVLGMPLKVLLYHTPCQGRIFLWFRLNWETVGGVRDKESTAITITLPLALDRALQALADQKHCGNKSAAIREVLYKEAGMKAKLRLNEKTDNAAVANAERRSAKYGSRKTKSRK